MRLIVIVGFLLLSISGFSQNERYAQSSGNWTSVTWTNDKAGAIPAAAPTSNDDVFTNGQTINITATSVTVRNLAVSASVAGSLNWTGSGTVTVRGALVTWDDANDSPAPPSVSVFSGTSRITLTAADLSNIFALNLFNNEILGYWNDTAPITNLTINLAGDATLDADIGSDIRITNQLQITGSGRTLTTGFNIAGIQIVNAFVIGSGVTFDTAVPVRSSSLVTSRVTTASISGTLITTNFFNCSNFNLTATGLLRTTFSGTDQTQGWWYQSTSPTGGTTNAASTIYFEADANQNIPARTYGNLVLDASSNVTKTLSSGTLNIAGSLTINSSSVTFNSNAATSINIGANLVLEGDWSPADPVVFNGTVAQSIQGNGDVTFSGGLQLNKSLGTLTLNKNIIVANGITITLGTLNLGSQTVTLNSGNITNNGTFTPTSSTMIINGATTINGVNPVSFHHLTIAASGNLSSSGSINISGNLSNSGGTVNAVTVLMNGTALQTITGIVAIENVTSSNSVGVSNNGTINLTGTLTLSGSGVFDTDGSGSGIFNIISDDLTSNAGIATLTTPSNLSGNVNVQRFVNGPDDYRYFSVPVSGATVSLWQDDFPVTGNFSNPSPNGVNGVVSSTAPSIFRFDAPTQAYVAIGTGASTAATSLSSTVGYSAYTYLTGDFLIDMAGQPTKGNVNVPLSAAGAGWNLVPNPYPSPIDWDNVSRTGTSGSMYLTTAQGSFATYLAGSGTCTGCSFNSGWRGEVAIGQSFWIESTGSTTLALTETAKTTSSATYVREADESIDMFRITLKSQGKEDDLIIRFDDEATFATELTLDSKKRLNDYYLNISSYNTNPAEHYAINGIPLATCGASNVKLKMSNLSGTSHSLAFTELDKLTLGYTVTLKDNFTSTERTIVNGDEYSFQTTTDPASKVDGRFELRFTSPAIQAVASSAIAVESTCESNLLNINISNAQSGVAYQLFKGETPVSSVVNGTGSDLNTIVLKSSLSAGLNVLNLKASTLDGCQTTTFDNIVSYELVNVPQVLSVTGASVCNTGNATLTAQGSSEAVAYLWYDSQLNDATYVQTVGNALTLEGVNESKSYYVTTLNKNGCESLTRTEVSVQVTTLNMPEVSLNGTTLLSSSATGNQWYKNGVIIPGATASSYEVTETGIYTVAVTTNTCSVVSAEITVAITGLEFKGEQSIAIYPNPVNDWLTIELAEDIVTQVKSLKLIDTKGVLVSAYNPEEIINGTLSINMVDQAKGIYHLAIRAADRTLIYRIIKN